MVAEGAWLGWGGSAVGGCPQVLLRDGGVLVVEDSAAVLADELILRVSGHGACAYAKEFGIRNRLVCFNDAAFVLAMSRFKEGDSCAAACLYEVGAVVSQEEGVETLVTEGCL